MGELSKAFATPDEFEFRGQKYKLAALKGEIMAAFEIWLKEKALRGLAQMRGALTPEEYQDQRNQIFKDIASGEYDFVSRVGVNSYHRSFEGMKHLLFLRLKKEQPDMTREFAEEIFEQQLEELIERAEAMDHDPNSKTPAAQQPPATT